MNPLRCYAVDDEELSLASLVRLLDATGRTVMVGTATDPVLAVEEIQRVQPDVLFVDIHMPELDGFGLLSELPRPPLVVFTTAYDHHAVRAFEVNSVDYLLKPITTARLAQAIQRLEQRVAQQPPDIAHLVRQLHQGLTSPSYLRRLCTQQGGESTLIDVAAVSHFLAEDRFTYAVTASGKRLLDASLTELEKRLDPAHFLRVHRSAIVNLDHVQSINRWFGGRLLLRLKGQPAGELRVSRAHVQRLRDALGL